MAQQYTPEKLRLIGKHCKVRTPPASVLHHMCMYETQKETEDEHLFQNSIFDMAQAVEDMELQQSLAVQPEDVLVQSPNGGHALPQHNHDVDYETLDMVTSLMQSALALPEEDITVLFEELNALVAKLNEANKRIDTVTKQADERVATVQKWAKQHVAEANKQASDRIVAAEERIRKLEKASDARNASATDGLHNRINKIEATVANATSAAQKYTNEQVAQLRKETTMNLRQHEIRCSDNRNGSGGGVEDKLRRARDEMLDRTSMFKGQLSQRLEAVEEELDDKLDDARTEMMDRTSAFKGQLSQRLDSVEEGVDSYVDDHNDLSERIVRTYNQCTGRVGNLEGRVNRVEDLVRAYTGQQQNRGTLTLKTQQIVVESPRGQALVLSVPKGSSHISRNKENIRDLVRKNGPLKAKRSPSLEALEDSFTRTDRWPVVSSNSVEEWKEWGSFTHTNAWPVVRSDSVKEWKEWES